MHRYSSHEFDEFFKLSLTNRKISFCRMTRVAIGERVIAKGPRVFAVPSSNLSSYYTITSRGPLMGPMLCTKESRYTRWTRVHGSLCVQRRVAVHGAVYCTRLTRSVDGWIAGRAGGGETVTRNTILSYVTFERVAAFTAGRGARFCSIPTECVKLFRLDDAAFFF